MEIVNVTERSATVRLSRFEVVALLAAIASLPDLVGLGVRDLSPNRQSDVDDLYGVLHRLDEAMAAAESN